MATAEDYLTREFGSFTILYQLGHGAEAEVFLCIDSRTHRAYVLRLSIHDDSAWDGEPEIPPRNSSIEKANAIGSWHAKQAYEAYTSGPDDGGWTINVPVVYGLLNQRYLIPVSDPFILRDSLSINRLLEISPPNDLYLFEAWEDIALTSLHYLDLLAKGALSRQAWEQNWGPLIHGHIMQQALGRYMHGGTLSAQEQAAIMSLVPDSYPEFPPLAENIILRLIGAITRGRCGLNEALRTLKSKYLRENLSYAELTQILLARDRLQENSSGSDTSLKLIELSVMKLTEDVFNHKDQPSEFELAVTQTPIDDFPLFLQEYAGDNRPLPTLVRERTEE